MSSEPAKIADPYERHVHREALRRRRLEHRSTWQVQVWLWVHVGWILLIFLVYHEILAFRFSRPFSTVAGIMLFALPAVFIRAATYLICGTLRHWTDLTWRTRVTGIVIWLIAVPEILLYFPYLYMAIEYMFIPLRR